MTTQLSVVPNGRVKLGYAFEDDAIVVVDKPAGVVTQPGRKHGRDTLLNGVFARHGKALQNLGKARDFGLVHRLDRATSGLVVVALTREAYDHLRAQFAERTIQKTYLAMVYGAPKPPVGTISQPIREVREGGRKRAVLGGTGAKAAETRYKVIGQAQGFSLLECQPKTGRLHQIRVHLARRRCPIVGDREYGRRDQRDLGKNRIGLHAAALRLTHPTTGKAITVRSPMPAAMAEALEARGLRCPRVWR